MTSTEQQEQKKNKKNDINYRTLFKDLVFGWSKVFHDNQTAYLKHLSIFDQVDIEEVREDFFNKAKDRGLPTNEEVLLRLDEEGLWASHDQGKIKEQEDYIKNAEISKKQLYLKADIDRTNNDIKEANKKLVHLETTKSSLMGQTCERYADGRVSDHYVIQSLYKDENLAHPFYTSEEIDDLTRKQMGAIVQSYNKIYSDFTDVNIQAVTLQDFYRPYMPFCEDVTNMFPKPLFELSLNQVKLVIYSRMFKNIFEQYQNIPESIAKDPQKIVDYVNAQEKAKENLSNIDKDGASTIMGAKNEDYEYLGIKKTSENSLSAKLREKGGKMDMKDLMHALKA